MGRGGKSLHQLHQPPLSQTYRSMHAKFILLRHLINKLLKGVYCTLYQINCAMWNCNGRNCFETLKCIVYLMEEKCFVEMVNMAIFPVQDHLVLLNLELLFVVFGVICTVTSVYHFTCLLVDFRNEKKKITSENNRNRATIPYFRCILAYFLRNIFLKLLS